MLRLQKGKVPQHQFVTESCGTELAVATKHSERERKEREGESVCVCVCVCRLCVANSPCCLLLHPHRLPTTAGRKKDLLQWCEWAEWREEKKRQRIRAEREREGWVCYKVREPRRIVILKLPDDSLFSFFFFPPPFFFFFFLPPLQTSQGKLGCIYSSASSSIWPIFDLENIKHQMEYNECTI